MNLIVEDGVNKEFQVFMSCPESKALFIMKNVNIINAKFGTYVTVYEGADVELFEKKYKREQGLFDKLVIKFNSQLDENVKPLSFWTRD